MFFSLYTVLKEVSEGSLYYNISFLQCLFCYDSWNLAIAFSFIQILGLYVPLLIAKVIVHSVVCKSFFDDYGHSISEGNLYIKGKYLEFEGVRKKAKVYKEREKTVFLTYQGDSSENCRFVPDTTFWKIALCSSHSGVVIKYMAQLKFIYHYKSGNNMCQGLCKFRIIG